MDLRNEKPSKNARDITWVPTYDDSWKYHDGGYEVGKSGPHSPYQQSDSALTGQPYGNLSPDEIEMMKSGASLRELLFMRLMSEDHTGPFKYEKKNGHR